MDLRKLGMWLVGFGAGATSVGLVVDAVQHADDPTLGQREGIFDLSSFSHALFFAGICLAVLGAILALFGKQFQALYAHVEHVTVTRRLAQVLAPIAAVVLVAGCAAAAGTSKLADGTGAPSAAESGDATTVAADGHGHAHGDETTTDGATAAGEIATDASGHDHGDVIPGTANGNSPCEEASPAPASPGQVGSGEAGGSGASGEGHGDRGMVVQQALTREERLTLEQQMIAAREVIAKYPTVKEAEAGGYHMSTPYVPCIGAHYTNIALVPKFDPAAPSELLYDGTTPDARIVGLSYLVYHPGGPPEGFAGANDHWHQHNANGGLCFKGGTVVGGEAMSREDCTAIGGQKRELTDIWMAHAWVVPGFECSWGVFSGECPELGGRVGGTAWES
jgi:hypothetical protein